MKARAGPKRELRAKEGGTRPPFPVSLRPLLAEVAAAVITAEPGAGRAHKTVPLA